MFGSDFVLSGLTTFLSMSVKYVFSMSVKYVFNFHLELKMKVTSTFVKYVFSTYF